MITPSEGRVGDLVRIIDETVCNRPDRNLCDVYRIIDRDSIGYYIENTRTLRNCGYLYAYRSVLVNPLIKFTRRLTVKAK